MTDQTIPAEKVRELAEKYDNAPGNPDRLLVNAIADLRALLPTQQPTTGLLGRWAKHDDYGDVLCMWDKPSRFGKMRVAHVSEGKTSGAEHWYAEFDSLTFPEQTTRPEDVPAGEAWRVLHCEDGEFNAVKTSGRFPWRFFNPEIEEHDGFQNHSVTLICPLTPERPGESDLQARYDALEQKYTELERKHFELGVELSIEQQANGSSNDWGDEQTTTPRIVATEAEYAALPIGSIVSKPDAPHIRHAVFKKIRKNKWERTGDKVRMADRHMAQMELQVLRYGGGDEQPKPVWRIEHDWRNLRVGEYIIDKNGDPVVTETKHWAGEPWYTDDLASVVPEYARFIVFPSKDAATPEAIEEAMKARDKETEK